MQGPCGAIEGSISPYYTQDTANIAGNFSRTTMAEPRLAGKVAIVTGAGQGFGEGITKKFIQEGSKVLLVDINAESGERVATAQPQGTAIFVHGDVSVETDWQKAVDRALAEFGKIDIIVNNAGVVNKAMVRPSWVSEADMFGTDADLILLLGLAVLHRAGRAGT